MSTQVGFAQQRAALLSHEQFKVEEVNKDWVYVKLKPTSNLNADAKFERLSEKGSGLNQLRKLRVPEGIDPVTFCNELRLSGDYLYADPVMEYQLLATPTDPLIANQYYLSTIKAFQAWDITTGDDDITIGIIDSGLDLDHEDIVGNLWINEDDTIDGIDNDNNGYTDDYYGYDFADLDNDPSIENGNHGMIVAGIAGARANNNQGIAGAGYNTKVAALKGFRSANNTSNGLYEAIIYAADNGLDVVNLSWGRMGLPLASEQDIINYAVLEKNMVVVAAAGNEGGKTTEEEKWYPASYDHVISVGATDEDDNKSSGSSFNYAVDIVAPGVSMFSTVDNNGYADGGPGTSYAAPLVAAGAALTKDKFPNLSAIQIMERVRATSDDVYDIGSNASMEGKLGKGRLNLLRAVSESNVKSIRANTTSISSSFDDLIFFGDTITVTSQVINYLNATGNPQIDISSPENTFTVIQKPDQIPFLGTLDTANISFEIVLDDSIDPEARVNIRLDYSEDTYHDFQFLEFTTSPNYVDFGNEQMSMTISGDGDLGYNQYGPNFEGSGFRFQGDVLMTYTGLMIGTNPTSVSDNIISNYTNQSRNEDFVVQKNYKLYHHQAADNFGYSEFTDLNHPITVEQSNIVWNGDDFMIVRYRIINHSADPINNLSFGIFADWDLGDKSLNNAAFDAVKNYAFSQNADASLLSGVQVLGNGSREYSVLDMSDANGNNADIFDLFTDEDKYDFLVNQELMSAGDIGGGNDVATISGITIPTLDSAEYEYVDVIYAVATSKNNLDSIFLAAQNKLEIFKINPRVLETFFTCDGSSFTLDPSNGINYQFYSDALGQNLVTTGSELTVTNLSSDTTFYVRNIDGDYPSDIFEVRLALFADIADFKMSTDTLYLDHTTNVVTFTDLSQQAVSWDWDFDQGTSSSIQNPALSFTEPGNYTIRLTVENNQGCVDSVEKTLVVANRPSPPTFDSFVVCPGENITLTDPDADKLNLYIFEGQKTPSFSGTSVQVKSIQFDTTVYVSGVYSSFESEKFPVTIDALEVAGRMKFIPDTTSEEFRLFLIADDLEAGSTVSWVINSGEAGTSETISVLAEGVIDVELSINSSEDCDKVLSKQIEVSSSPTPQHPDVISCNEDSVLIKPTNGTYFGFYEDPELSSLIKKGTQLKTNAYEKIYVTGLDDGLPGIPIEVNITNQSPEIEITYTSSSVGTKQKIDLSLTSSIPIESYEWYVNGSYLESVAEPSIFLDNELYEITVDATTADGCHATDTLMLDLIPPLSVDDADEWIIYPNPTTGVLFINPRDVTKVEVYQLDGKMILSPEIINRRVDLSSLNKGVYLLKIYTQELVSTHQLLLE
ncbi:S8 family serine peptidase [Ekhidna sp.]|uniref:S8 family serine peptidase n=1 Tax=Ekhidna sp. TaxID=2608089 RepID=UPI003CCB9CF4